MDIKEYVKKLRKNNVCVIAIDDDEKSVAIIFEGDYVIDINAKNTVCINYVNHKERNKIKFIDNDFIAIKSANFGNKDLIVNDQLNTYYFPHIKHIKTFNISQYKGKDVDTMLTELEISKYENDLKPILSIMLEAL